MRLYNKISCEITEHLFLLHETHHESDMEFKQITENKREYLPLLLLADEQEDMIDRYLDRGIMFVLEEEGSVIGVCVITDEGNGTAEIQNLAISPSYQGKGYGKAMIDHVIRFCSGNYKVLQVGTGDSPLTLPFYEHCGFTQYCRIRNYFPENYDHPIYEAGKQLIDKVCLKKDL